MRLKVIIAELWSSNELSYAVLRDVRTPPPKDLESDSHYQEHQFFVPLLQAEAACRVQYIALIGWLCAYCYSSN